MGLGIGPMLCKPYWGHITWTGKTSGAMFVVGVKIGSGVGMEVGVVLSISKGSILMTSDVVKNLS